MEKQYTEIPVKYVPKEMELVGAMAIANGPANSVFLTKVSNLFLIIYVKGHSISKSALSCQHFFDSLNASLC